MAFESYNRRDRKVMAELSRKEAAKRPAQLTEVPREQWQDACHHMRTPPERTWHSNKYLVQLYPKVNGVQRMSVNRVTLGEDGRWKDGITWDELQAIKAAIGFAGKCAVEIYPAECDKVDVANLRHLWLLDDPPPYRWINGELQ